MNYLCLSCRAEIPEGDQLCLRCKRELKKYMYRLNKHRDSGEIQRQEFRTLKGQALAGDIKGAKKGLERIGRRKICER